jgi:uncharacterized protein YndB with AHSA1/START domain
MITTESNTSDREIVIKRTLNAPRELVYKVWTEAEHIAKWWGPRAFTTTNKEMAVKVGGVWRFNMHGMGMDFPNKVVYTKVEKNERLEYSHGDDEREHFKVIVTFDDNNGKTDLTMRSIFPTVAERDAVVKEYGAIEGGNQTIDRLEEYLAQ